MVYLTNEEMAMLAPYEQSFRTAVSQSWARGLSRIAYEQIYSVYKRVHPKNTIRLNTNCAACLLNLLRDVGRYYFATQSHPQEQAAQAAPKKKRTTKKAE